VAKIPIAKLVAEVEKGLSTEAKDRMDDALMATRFFNFDGKQYMSKFANNAESPYDYANRPYRQTGLTREIVDVLTEHLYAPGPARKWDDAGADEFLSRVYEDNHVDMLMQRADQLSTLSHCAAIQVDADEGLFDDRPLTLRLWAAEEFAVWEDPDDRRRVAAVCTKDMYDQTTRYRLWTEEEVRTFETRKGDGTSGGRAPVQTEQEKNTYGCIPFAFTHYEFPVSQFWEPGIGGLVVDTEIHANDRLSRLDQAFQRFLDPIMTAEGMPDGWSLIVQPGQPIRIPRRAMVGSDSGFIPGPEPKLAYLQAMIDVAGAWEDVRNHVNQVLEAVRVPASAVRMEQTGVASGISLIVEQAPLLTRARKRRGPYGVYETELARTILRCAGNHYSRRDLLASARAGRLTLGWPTPSIPVQTDDWWDLEMKKVGAGAKSLIMVVSEAGGMQRDQAIEFLEQVKVDNEEMARIFPDMPVPTEPMAVDDQGNVDLRASENRLQPIDKPVPKEGDAL
jgi:hypothetical protein